MARPEAVERLRRITIGVVQPPKRAVMRRVDDGDVVISRELAREILTALDSASRFGAHIPHVVRRNDVTEWADSVRTDSRTAAERLRRAAMAQDEGRSA